MEAIKRKVVSKVFPNMEKVGQDGGNFLHQIRDTVQEVRAQDPELTDYHLYDLGFIQQDEGLEVKMYFTQ